MEPLRNDNRALIPDDVALPTRREFENIIVNRDVDGVVTIASTNGLSLSTNHLTIIRNQIDSPENIFKCAKCNYGAAARE